MVYHSWHQHSQLGLHGYDSILVLALETDCKYAWVYGKNVYVYVLCVCVCVCCIEFDV